MIKSFKIKLATLFILLTIFNHQSVGQLSKGYWLLGGNGSSYSYNQDYSLNEFSLKGKISDIKINATIGKFIADRFAIGLRPFATYFKAEYDDGDKINDLRYAIGPFARYYLLKDNKRFNLLADVGYHLGINRSVTKITSRGKYRIFTAMLGAEIFFNSDVGIEILTGYRYEMYGPRIAPDIGIYSQRGIYTSIGFQFHFRKE